MKNMKVRVKLFVAFLAIAILAAAVGISGIVGMLQMDAATSEMYDEQTVPLTYISTLTTLLQRMRVGMREYGLGAAANDMNQIETAYSTVDSLYKEIESYFDLYDPTITNAEARTLFDEARKTFEGSYMGHMEDAYQTAKAGDLQGCLEILTIAKGDTDTIVNNLDRCMEIRVASASETNQGTTVMARSLLILIIVILIIAVLAAVVFAVYISRLISTPLAVLTTFMNKAGTTGDIALSPAELDNIREFSQYKDETGQCIGSAASFIEHISEISETLGKVAEGDLTVSVNCLSDKDVIGVSLDKMLTSLNTMFGEINASTAQVSIGSKQIADGAQSLAQGSTEQAAAVQELSSSIAEIAEKTIVNAEMAGKAAKLADTIKGNAEKGSHQMDEMTAAVKEINEASQNISKVINVIDNIAFQTNILALNAAVEAARAGQHGKGFAVVAEEVRSLAAKSAEAAKDTGGLIANSMEKAELGTRIANETAASLVEIVSGINESSKLVSDIAKSSDEQSIGISQINKGIDQVAQVVQQNSATAEQSAAASEEMSGQADMLENLIAQFKLKGSGNRYQSLPSTGTGGSRGASDKHFSAPSNNGGSYGKY